MELPNIVQHPCIRKPIQLYFLDKRYYYRKWPLLVNTLNNMNFNNINIWDKNIKNHLLWWLFQILLWTPNENPFLLLQTKTSIYFIFIQKWDVNYGIYDIDIFIFRTECHSMDHRKWMNSSNVSNSTIIWIQYFNSFTFWEYFMPPWNY